jgi:hypothetical protein
MVEGFSTELGSLHEYLQVLHHLLLSAEITERQRAERILKVFLRTGELLLSDVKIFVYHLLFACKDKVNLEKNQIYLGFSEKPII